MTRTAGSSSNTLRRVAVFCGSSPGQRPAYRQAAEDLGRLLVARGIGLVYGGASVGLMGTLADAVIDAGGTVTGVIPRHLVEFEVAHAGLDDLRVVDSMHERKALMTELSDAFVTLPGGFGTLEETFEVVTWRQLGLHQKPVGLLDVEGYFAALIAFLDQMVDERFLSADNREFIAVETDPAALLDRLTAAQRAVGTKWLDREKT